MAEEMGVDQEIQELLEIRRRVDDRLNKLRMGATPIGANPGMGYGVGPDRPPLHVAEPKGLLV